MNTTLKAIGWTLMVLGVLVVVFSRRIVFPGLELLLGIETIVGSENVSHQPDGSYYYTNPGAMIRWILSVAGVGLLICAFGVAMLWLSRRAARRISDERVR
jgi:hypothetical protein